MSYLFVLCFCSHLLKEDLEPFEVLPKGKIGPSLVMALRVLFASEEDFSLWHNLEGQLSSFAKLQLFRPACLSVCLSVCPSVCPSVCLSGCPHKTLTTQARLFVALSIRLSICLYVCLFPQSFNSFNSRPVCLSVCLDIGSRSVGCCGKLNIFCLQFANPQQNMNAGFEMRMVLCRCNARPS